ncbi:MAG: insulysin [Alteromonadaceae bacterium]|jgi:insulysin
METTLKKSPNDPKHYQAITLSNGLRVLLVENNETKNSAAALAVNVGHFNDPVDRQGMAHFLEHMLFLGTKKYPDGSEYQKFINQYGGSNNAWTATEHTCFFLDINHQYFEDALDRFSQFFTEPLLSEEFVTKERENIDAEFKLKLKDDIRRLYDVHKETINQAHPFSKFSVGNTETLADHNDTSIRSEIKAFFDEHYQASHMTLVLEGPHTLNTLKKYAEQKFGSIADTNKAPPPIQAPLYLPEHQQLFIQVKPVKNDKQLIISFAMPSIDQFYRHKPESVLAYLIGHEGPGSILSLLKSKQWAMGLTAGSGINGSNFKDFNISIQLTDEGELHIEQIIDIVFAYITLLNKETLAEYYYQEKKSIAELSFHYHEKQKPLDSVCQLVINMQHYPVDDYIFGDYVMDGQCPEITKDMLSYLTASNMRLVHISQNNTFDKTSRWYRVPYAIQKIEENKITKWSSCQQNDAIFLPGENPYIVANPKVLTHPDNENKNQQIPKLIEKECGYSLWYKADTTFNVPKGYIYIGIDAPITIANNKNIAMSRLFVDLFSDAIIEQHYNAELAGIHYHLYSHQGGMTLQLSGLSEKQGDLLTLLLNSLKTQQVAEQRFNLIKQHLTIHWQNSDTSKSISQLFSILSSTMQPKNPSSEVLAAVLDEVSYADFVIFSQQIFTQVSIDVLIHGNWHQSHAQDISEQIKQAFAQQTSDQHQVHVPVLDLQEQGEILLPLILPEHDHATVLYYPLADKTLHTIAKTMIASQLLSPVFFQEMRTERQYGYLVGVGFIPINRYPGIAFYIQSPHTESTILINAIDEFIEESLTHLSAMPEEAWQHLQQGLAGQLQEKDSNLRIKSQRFWAAICNNEGNFDQKQKLISAILSLTLADIHDFIATLLAKSNHPDRITLATFTSTEHHMERLNNKNKNSEKTQDIKGLLKNCQRKY